MIKNFLFKKIKPYLPTKLSLELVRYSFQYQKEFGYNLQTYQAINYLNRATKYNPFYENKYIKNFSRQFKRYKMPKVFTDKEIRNSTVLYTIRKIKFQVKYLKKETIENFIRLFLEMNDFPILFIDNEGIYDEFLEYQEYFTNSRILLYLLNVSDHSKIKIELIQDRIMSIFFNTFQNSVFNPKHLQMIKIENDNNYIINKKLIEAAAYIHLNSDLFFLSYYNLENLIYLNFTSNFSSNYRDHEQKEASAPNLVTFVLKNLDEVPLSLHFSKKSFKSLKHLFINSKNLLCIPYVEHELETLQIECENIMNFSFSSGSYRDFRLKNLSPLEFNEETYNFEKLTLGNMNEGTKVSFPNLISIKLIDGCSTLKNFQYIFKANANQFKEIIIEFCPVNEEEEKALHEILSYKYPNLEVFNCKKFMLSENDFKNIISSKKLKVLKINYLKYEDFENLSLEQLEKLTLKDYELNNENFQSVCKANIPNLKHLHLDTYSLKGLKPVDYLIMSSFNKLTYINLGNSSDVLVNSNRVYQRFPSLVELVSSHPVPYEEYVF